MCWFKQDGLVFHINRNHKHAINCKLKLWTQHHEEYSRFSRVLVDSVRSMSYHFILYVINFGELSVTFTTLHVSQVLVLGHVTWEGVRGVKQVIILLGVMGAPVTVSWII